MTYVKRPLEALVNREESAWPQVQEWIKDAKTRVEILQPSESAADALVSLQVTTRSPMGAVILHTGGILIDDGWVRVLGSGHPRLPRSLPAWNFACGMAAAATPPPCLLVADDVLGGFFALNGGKFAPGGHNVWYFAPDTLEWEDLGRGYSEFLVWSFSGALAKFYAPFRWPDWQAEVSALPGDMGLMVYPFLSTEGPEIAGRTRGAVPISELFSIHVGAV